MRPYYVLTKPGIVYSHAMIAVAGLFFAAHHAGVSIPLAAATLFGVSLIVASYCVFNNVLDRDIDALMERTKGRALPAHDIDVLHALAFASMLGIFGIAVLFIGTNLLTLLVAVFGAFSYLALYTPAKRRTVHSTIIGTLSGGWPLVAGYTAYTNSLDSTALILFIILLAWQMVHFFSIALYHLTDYQAANIPVFPVRLGVFPTKAVMLVYSFVYAFANYALFAAAGATFTYLVVLESLSLVWTAGCVYGFFTADDALWGKRMFFYSLFVILAFSLTLALS